MFLAYNIPTTIFFNLDFLVEVNIEGFSYSLIAAIIFSTRFSLLIIDFLLSSPSFIVSCFLQIYLNLAWTAPLKRAVTAHFSSAV